MHCLADRPSCTVRTTSPLSGLCLCLITLVACLSGCGDEATAPSGSPAVDATGSGGGGLSSLFGGSPEEPAEETSSATLKTGDVISSSIGMKLGVVPPGEFSMGSPETEEKRSGDESRHRVRLTKPVLMSIYEITQAEFQQVMETNPSGIMDSDRLPVQNVSWEQAVAFCRKLSELPEEKAAGRVYRLPTEAEWEYACRAGSATSASFGDSITSAQANFDGNYPYGTSTVGTFVGKPQAVGSYEPNAWGFYDMHGNVWEWCEDWYAADYYSSAAADDPTGPETGISHVIRGGSWYNFGYILRSAYRSEFTPPLESDIYGFRVVASFGPDNTFERSELDTAVPAPMSTPSPTPDAPAVVATPTTPMMSSPEGATAMAASSTSAMSRMSDTDSLSDATSAVDVAPSATESTGSRSRSASRPTGPVGVSRFVLFSAALLALLSLVDPNRLNQHRHYDILPLLLTSVVAILPSSTLQTTLLQILCIAVAARLIVGLRGGSLPKAVIPRLPERTLLLLTVGAFVAVTGLHVTGGASNTLVELITATCARGAIALALVLIGTRWRGRTLGLSLALVWLVLPGNDPTLAAALILWAFVFVNRAPLAGVAAGCAIAMNWWLCFLVPLWFSYYRGRARTRFLTTAATCGIVGFLALTILPSLLAIREIGVDPTSAGVVPLIQRGVAIAILSAAATATWFWPENKSEVTFTAMCAILLLGVFVCSRTGSAMGIAMPWLILVLSGGCASRSSPVIAEGLVIPGIRRLVKLSTKVSTP